MYLVNDEDIDVLKEIYQHLLECEKKLDEHAGLGEDAGSGCSTIACNLDNFIRRLENDPLPPHIYKYL